ncbi:MAG: T9SS type A sorting domain-containing protein [Bacteroidota bacterium]
MKNYTFIFILVFICHNLFSQNLSVEVGSIPATAISQCTGKAWAHAIDGVAPYSFVWSTGDTSIYIENLCLGTYTVTVTDALDSISIDSVVFSPSTQIILEIQGLYPISAETFYNHCNGSVGFNLNQGIPPYHYQLFDESNGVLVYDDSIVEYGYISNLCQGRYFGVCTDSNGAKGIQTIQVNNNFIDYNSPSYDTIGSMIKLTVTGIPPIQVAISSSADTLHFTRQNTIDTISYSALHYGNHTISLIDSVGNTDNSSFCIKKEVFTTVIPQDATNGCNGSISLSNPLSYNLYFNIPDTNFYVYLDNFNNNLCPGSYLIEISDEFCPCIKYPQNVTIGGANLNYPTIDINTVNTSLNNCIGEAWADVSGGNPPYKYKWGLANTYFNDTTLSINNLCDDKSYFVIVSDSSNIWSVALVDISSDSPQVNPGDTLWGTADTCITNIDYAFVYTYTIHPSTVDVKWKISQGGVVSYLDYTYNYSISLPGTYYVGLVFSCKSLNSLFAILNIKTDVSEKESNELKVYPNPVSDYLHLSLNEKVVSFDIFTINGQYINTYSVEGALMSINVSNLSEGVYFIRFMNTDGSYIVKKFIK